MLAHEGSLQALVAYTARTEPRFIDHPRDRFVETTNMARREHHDRETDDHVAEFIRAVMRLGDVRAPPLKESDMAIKKSRSREDMESPRPSDERPAQRDQVQVRERNGIWEVKDEGIFRGDYHQKEHALAAAALLKLSRR